mmetsp:Transcript_42577/g.132450  ORF Transcript_42577/g.132450 Transcript_42577/m.132450 type:complete len:337 (+) Transcript_42577:429-1439(+)
MVEVALDDHVDDVHVGLILGDALVDMAATIDLPEAKADGIPASDGRVHAAEVHAVHVVAQQGALPMLYHARGPAKPRVAVADCVEDGESEALACVHLQAHVDVPPQLGDDLVGEARQGLAGAVCVVPGLGPHAPDPLRGGLEAVPDQHPSLDVEGPLDHPDVRLAAVPRLRAELLVALLEGLCLEAAAELVQELADGHGRGPHNEGPALAERRHGAGPVGQSLRAVLQPGGHDRGELRQGGAQALMLGRGRGDDAVHELLETAGDVPHRGLQALPDEGQLRVRGVLAEQFLHEVHEAPAAVPEEAHQPLAEARHLGLEAAGQGHGEQKGHGQDKVL